MDHSTHVADVVVTSGRQLQQSCYFLILLTHYMLSWLLPLARMNSKLSLCLFQL
jgi:hypothetical protein